MKLRSGVGALLLIGLTAVPVVATGGVASAAPAVVAQQSTQQIAGVPQQDLPSQAEQTKIQNTIKRVGPGLAEGQSVLVDTYRGTPIYVQKQGGLVRVQVGNAKSASGIQPRFSFCADLVVPAALAAIAAAGGAAAILTGGIVLPEYGIVITAAQLQAAAAGTTLVNALYNLVKAEICG